MPGSRFPITGVGAVDNAVVWYRGLFSTLGCALAACGPSGKEVSPFRANLDDPLDQGTAPCKSLRGLRCGHAHEGE